MKIDEIFGFGKPKPKEDIGTIVLKTVDFLIAAYYKKAERKFGMIEFSNEIGNNIRKYAFDLLIDRGTAKDEDEIAELKREINKISDNYIEYKLNNIIA